MELYTKVSYDISRLLTHEYSTSFGGATKLFPLSIRKHIYAIYGLVRIADEVVDTYRGKDVAVIIDELEKEVYGAVKRGYSTNPIIHAFATTAKMYSIDRSLIHPFFVSMKMDLNPVAFTKKLYTDYIYGSAEVVGLMCLKVFCESDKKLYSKLERGAKALGSAYQKVNFLRDMAADYTELGRVYFPGVSFESFDETAKKKIIADIEKDFALAKKAVEKLPSNSHTAVSISVVYYEALLRKLKRTKASALKQKRVRINNAAKFVLFSKATIVRKLSDGS